MGMLKKMLLGIVGLVVIVAFIGWKTAVAVHDRKSTAGNEGNLSTALDLLANFLPNHGKQAKAAFAKGDYETARKLYQPLADRGNQDAMLHLAVMNAEGQGGTVDHTQAVKWFRLLADQGDREAQFGLGLAYQNGKGVQQDYAEASRWYQKSARQGSPAARVNLGVLYMNGQGVAPDPIEAQKWFILSGQTGEKNRAVLDGRLTAEQNANAKKRAAEAERGK